MIATSARHLLTLLPLLLVPRGASGRDPNAVRPSNRFLRYCGLSSELQAASSALGYSSSSWDGFSASIEQQSYSEISSTSLSNVQKLLTGSTYQASWDCWINHYSSYTWSELGSTIQGYYTSLGWTQSSWDGGGTASTEDKDWSQLTTAEQTAAGEVCFEQSNWDQSLGGSCSGSGGVGAAGCLSGINEVYVRDKGLVALHQLSIGDHVMTEGGEFSRVYSFLHLDPAMELDYLQIHVNGLQNPLEISPEHMLLVNGQMVRASLVQVGDVLGRSRASDRVVKRIGSVARTGAYAPVTEKGDIVVSGVVASCFVDLLDHCAIDQHLANHYFLAPVRLLCAMHFGICENETYTDGYSNWVYHMKLIIEAANTCAPLIQAVLSLALMPFLVAANVLVTLLMSTGTLCAIALGGFVLSRHAKKPKKVV